MHNSPTDKKGRIHTSTVVVSVLEPIEFDKNAFNINDVDIVTTRGSGPGGQNRNKVESCVVATHKPTGITCRVDMRDQHQSKSMALKILSARVVEQSRQLKIDERHTARKEQQGCGARGDKIRTYRVIDDQVTDHRSNQKWPLKKWMKGDW